jgi:hypothetical protein
MSILRKIALCAAVVLAFVVVVTVGASLANAVVLQQEVEVAWVCKNQADVEAQIDSIVATKSTEQANALLKEKIASGDCAQSPIGPFAATVTKLGKAREPIDFKGRSIAVLAVQVDDKFWTGTVEVIGNAN